jgi:hypothetical protein
MYTKRQEVVLSGRGRLSLNDDRVNDAIIGHNPQEYNIMRSTSTLSTLFKTTAVTTFGDTANHAPTSAGPASDIS